MTTLQQSSFFLLRYVPDAVKNEFVNIGLVLLPAGGMPEVRFTHDWSRVKCLDANADLELLEALESDFREQLRGTKGDRDVVLARIQDSFSNAVQPSEAKACLAESPVKEADELARLYLERPRRRGEREVSSREIIFRTMQQEFERNGVLPLLSTKIRVADYARSGDPQRIDFGYAANGTIKMFHAVSLADANSAKLLAFSFPQLAEGVRRRQGKSALLTAVVEDDFKREDESVNFAVETLESQSIAVAPLALLPQLASTAARELGVM
ncbi:MAG TPA: DUF3037 domain-containing protein [Terriglobales bacterium]|nr:DUF3037 domain-containing protein [Terriglobales bacterium]